MWQLDGNLVSFDGTVEDGSRGYYLTLYQAISENGIGFYFQYGHANEDVNTLKNHIDIVPTHFIRLLALPEQVRARYKISSIEIISHTGAKCPVDAKRAMIDLRGPKFIDAYGASEVGTACLIDSEEWLTHPGSVGKSIAPFSSMILDDDNQPVPAKVEGKLFFEDATGRGVVYNNDPVKSAEAHIAPGVLTLGEIGYMNAEGYVYITDRFSDMIVSGRVNIYPEKQNRHLSNMHRFWMLLALVFRIRKWVKNSKHW